MPKEATFWREYNFAMIRASSRLRVLRLEGWNQSVGVKDELSYAIRLGKPIIYHNPGALLDAAATVEVDSNSAQPPAA
jgi:hypothetical protein